jgi:hypothetical protein
VSLEDHDPTCHRFDKKGKNQAADWKENLIKLGSFNTIEGFWKCAAFSDRYASSSDSARFRLYCFLERPQRLPKETDLYMFREEEVPMWEVSRCNFCRPISCVISVDVQGWRLLDR